MGDIQLNSRTSYKEYVLFVSILEEARVSCMTILLNPTTFEVPSLDKRSALKFYAGTCSTSKEKKHEDKFRTFYRYFISRGSLAWDYPDTWLAIRWELHLDFNLVDLISKERIISVMKALYSSWLLLEMNSNFNACSITISHSPSNIIPAPLPFLEVPSKRRPFWRGILLGGWVELEYKVGQGLRLDALP